MATPSDAVTAITDEQRTLLAKLASLTEMAEQYRASLYMVEHERLQVQTKLRLAGYSPPAPRDADG
jgi:hypothetical protein